MEITKEIRQQVWLHYVGEKIKSSCYNKWCTNEMTIFNHHIVHSKDGKNLRPICVNCKCKNFFNYCF